MTTANKGEMTFSRYILTSVRFDGDEYLMLQNLAQMLHTSNSQIIRNALRVYYSQVKTQKQNSP